MDTKDLNSDPLNLIFGRRSIRVYAPGEIDDSTVTRLLGAAMAAPSAMTKDPWRFIIVRELASLKTMAEALPGGKMLITSTLAIVVCGDLEVAFEQQLSFLLQDCSAAIENLLLAAHGLDLGACWVGVHPNEAAIRKLKNLFRLPPSVLPIAVVSLGFPGEDPGPRTRFDTQKVHREKWEG
jgi:nitroreductase